MNATQLKAQNSQRYINSVRQFADKVLKIARSTTGSGLFCDGVEVASGLPAQWPCDGAQNVLCNVAGQQNLFRTLVGLSAITGDAQYHDAAVAAMRETLSNLMADNGLIYWGGHAAVDRETQRAYGHGPPHHELKRHYPFYELMWQVDPSATRRYIEALWSGHVFDFSVLDISRHANMQDPPADRSPWSHEYVGGPVFFVGKGLSFVNAGSDLYFAAAMLGNLSGDEQPLVWAQRLAARYDQTRNPDTGLVGYQFSQVENDRAKKQFGAEYGDRLLEGTFLEPGRASTRYGIAGVCQLLLGKELGEQGHAFTDWAVQDLTALIEHAYDPTTNLIQPMITDGHRLGPEDYKREGYYSLHTLEPKPAPAVFLRAFALAYQASSNEAFRDAAHAVARSHGLDRKSYSADSSMDDPATLIVGLLDLHAATDDRNLLKQACLLADQVLEQQMRNDLFVRSQAHRFARFDDRLPLALLLLSERLLGKSGAVPVDRGGKANFICAHDDYPNHGRFNRIEDRVVLWDQLVDSHGKSSKN